MTLIQKIEQLALFAEPAHCEFGLRDPDDEVYLATAVAGDAVLVTGNLRDFTAAEKQKVNISNVY